MEELYECLIKLQSYFARPNSQLGPSIEESLRSIFLFLLDLKKLFSSHREYQDLSKSEQNNIIWYLQQVEQYWNSHNEKQQNKKLFDETLTSLRQIIVKHYKNEEQDNNLTYQDLAQELQKKEFQIEVLKMEIDSVTRKQNRESEKQLFQKFSEEMKLLKQINQDLKLSLKEEQQKRISEKKIFDEKQRQFKKIQHKPFEITQLEQENEQLKQFNEQLLNRISNLEEDVKRKQTQELDNKELYRLKSENKRIIDENSSLEQQLTQLYDKLDLSKQNELENNIQQLEKKITTLTLQLQKSNDDQKILTQTNDQLLKKIKDLKSRKQVQMDIQLLPEMKNVSSHFNCVIHLLQHIPQFSQLLKGDDQVCALLNKCMQYIEKKSEQIPQNAALALQDILPIDQQNDQRANDFLFQIVDYLSKAVSKSQGQPQSTIASIIQAQDSQIYDMFFFLQRIFPMDMDIQQNEVPLINSIKHVRYFEAIVKHSQDFSTYLKNLIILEGQENFIDEQDGVFNFLVFPQILILNVYELSLAKSDIKINTILDTSVLNESSKIQYQLIAIVHCAEGSDKVPLYYLTLKKEQQWVQILFDSAEGVNLDDILTFAKPVNDKELLIYEKINIINNE